MKLKWKNQRVNSAMYHPTKKDLWVSYNPNTDTGEETALCFNGLYYIVMGDIREQVNSCTNWKSIAYEFLKNNNLTSKWSNASIDEVKEYFNI